MLTPYRSLFFVWPLTCRAVGASVEAFASTLVNAQVELNPHQVEAALLACEYSLNVGYLPMAEQPALEPVQFGLFGEGQR